MPFFYLNCISLSLLINFGLNFGVYLRGHIRRATSDCFLFHVLRKKISILFSLRWCLSLMLRFVCENSRNIDHVLKSNLVSASFYWWVETINIETLYWSLLINSWYLVCVEGALFWFFVLGLFISGVLWDVANFLLGLEFSFLHPL